MKAIGYMILPCMLLLAAAGCRQDGIDYYDPQYNAVRFPGTGAQYQASEMSIYPGSYDITTATYYYTFTFRTLEDPSVAHTDLDIPIVWMGMPPVADRPINIVVEENEANAPAGTYEIVEALIPAGGYSGHVKLRVFNDDELLSSVRMLNIGIGEGDGYMLGDKNHLKANVSWSASVSLPTGNQRITYNMLIKSSVAWSSTATTHCSTAAVSTILNATGWSVLPNYGTIYTGELYKGWAARIGAYIAEYNAANPDNPLVHDSGTMKGQPIEARTY
jgi:hypothetical protein